MADAIAELHEAMIGALRDASSLSALVGTEIYDTIPTVARYPRITFGPEQAISDDSDCRDSFEAFSQIDVWSRISRAEAMTIAGVIRAVLHGVELPLADNALLLIEHRTTRYLDDPDRITQRASMEFRALIEAA